MHDWDIVTSDALPAIFRRTEDQLRALRATTVK
jgi:hypothetical protein